MSSIVARGTTGERGLGDTEGEIDGETDKLRLGEIEGDKLGLLLKLIEGESEGLLDKLTDGDTLKDMLGLKDGL